MYIYVYDYYWLVLYISRPKLTKTCKWRIRF